MPEVTATAGSTTSGQPTVSRPGRRPSGARRRAAAVLAVVAAALLAAGGVAVTAPAVHGGGTSTGDWFYLD